MVWKRNLLGAAAAIGLSLATGACDSVLTEAPEAGDLLDGPIEGLSPAELAAFVEGDEQFGRPFSVAEGLGPIFNNVACAACHSGDGRGRRENSLTRISRGTDPALDVGGPQIQDRAIAGAEPEVVPAGVDVSVRLPPPVFGVGQIEAIPVAAILANADENDGDGDGISGRPNWVTSPSFIPPTEPGGGSGQQLGRFSRKAQISTILEQIVGAYHQDMGITTDFRPVENFNPQVSRATEASDLIEDPELGAAQVLAVLNYVRMLAIPEPGEMTAAREAGQTLFSSVGCAACHTPSFTTGESVIPALSGQTVFPFSDFLLHDMGDDLADNRPDGSADGREWRTTPLWGLRLMRDFLNGDAFLLHDGRAASVREAILAHGGEARVARDAFEALVASDQESLTDFVGSR